jgi:hypothetical protein
MFPTFPSFEPLKISDKESYNHLVADYPASSDICFSTLHIWWNLSNQLEISTLNDNVIIHYLLPFDDENSGYSVIGVNKVEETMQTIFEYLQTKKLPVRLVHVPEFTLDELVDRQKLITTEELDYNEYLMDSTSLATLEGHDLGRIRRKVARFVRETEDTDISTGRLDLSKSENVDLIMKSIVSWEKARKARNDPDHTEHDAIRKTLEYAVELEAQNLCLYLDGALHGIVLYDMSFDGKSYIIHHLKVNYDTPFIFDYVTQLIAEQAVKDNIPLVNMEMDLGIENLRYHKMNLKPVGFHRKYTVQPHN